MNIKKILPILLCNVLVSFCILDAMSEQAQMVPMATMQNMMQLSVKQAVKDELQKAGLGPKRWISMGTMVKYGIPIAAIGFGGYYLYKKSAWIRQLAKKVTPVTQDHLDSRVGEIKAHQDEHHQEDMAGHDKTHELILSRVATKEDVSNLGETITGRLTSLWNGIRGLFPSCEA